MKTTKQCYRCKQQFRKEELIDYASPNAKCLHSYCKKCLIEKQEQDNFSMKVCQIFGLKNPGPRIWKERKQLKDKFGYTDNIIIDCLDYIYSVEKKQKLSESLYFVNPTTVEKMMKWKRREQNKASQLANAYQTEIIEHFTSIKENNDYKKNQLNPDDWLED